MRSGSGGAMVACAKAKKGKPIPAADGPELLPSTAIDGLSGRL